MNKASLCPLLTLRLVSRSHAQHESSLCTDGIGKKSTWPASVGISGHVAPGEESRHPRRGLSFLPRQVLEVLGFPKLEAPE